MKQTILLSDWRDADERDDNDPPGCAADLSVADDAVRLEFHGPAEGGHVWIEFEAGRVRVHCYCRGVDEPVNVEIYPDRIEVDAVDYADPITFQGEQS
jgi:hypothetical protein